MQVQDYIIRPKQLQKILGVSKATLWRMSQRGELPPKKKISRGVVGYLKSDVDQMLQNAHLGDEGVAK